MPVIGCPNSSRHLNKWSSIYKIHKCILGKIACDCEPSFWLLAIPTELKNKKACIQWTKAVYRQNENGKLWLQKKLSKVCSAHFVSGKPTDDNPDQELNLGYRTPVKPTRKLPSARSGEPTKRAKGFRDHTQIVNRGYVGAMTETTLNAGSRKEVDLAACNVGNKFYPDNNQSSRRPPHITHDHG